jgi:hypothetical protein
MSSRGVRKTGRYSRRLNGFLCIDRDRLRFAEYKVRVLEERLRLVLIEKYAPGSEKLAQSPPGCENIRLLNPKLSATESPTLFATVQNTHDIIGY